MAVSLLTGADGVCGGRGSGPGESRRRGRRARRLAHGGGARGGVPQPRLRRGPGHHVCARRRSWRWTGAGGWRPGWSARWPRPRRPWPFPSCWPRRGRRGARDKPMAWRGPGAGITGFRLLLPVPVGPHGDALRMVRRRAVPAGPGTTSISWPRCRGSRKSLGHHAGRDRLRGRSPAAVCGRCDRARVPGTWWAFTARRSWPRSSSTEGCGSRRVCSSVRFRSCPPLRSSVRGRALPDRRWRSSAVVMVLALVAYTQKTTGFVYQP